MIKTAVNMSFICKMILHVPNALLQQVLLSLYQSRYNTLCILSMYRTDTTRSQTLCSLQEK